ncbi:hypothetical protein GQ457_18G014710 [Hibiscus cannabinus]
MLFRIVEKSKSADGANRGFDCFLELGTHSFDVNGADCCWKVIHYWGCWIILFSCEERRLKLNLVPTPTPTPLPSMCCVPDEIKHLDQLSFQIGSTLFLVYIFQIIWLAGSHSVLSNRGSRIIAFLGFTGCWDVLSISVTKLRAFSEEIAA